MGTFYDANEQTFDHIGVLERSGRYPWGSGETPYQRLGNWKAHYVELKNHEPRHSEQEIAAAMGINTKVLRQRLAIASAEERLEKIQRARNLANDPRNYSKATIAKMMGLPNESSVRELLKDDAERKAKAVFNTADVILESVERHGMIDIGKGSEAMLGVTKTKFDNAISILQDEGYKVQYVQVLQGGTGKKTTIKVLTKPDVPWKEVNANKDNIALLNQDPDQKWSIDGGISFKTCKDPVLIDPKRIKIVYAEDGGESMDGMIEIRPGVPELALHDRHYCQVRIGVDYKNPETGIKGLYCKGVAIYNDNLPEGCDIRVWSNKSKSKGIEKALKPMYKNSDDDPFGAAVRQFDYPDKNGKMKQSAINIVNEEGDWANWSKTISSQVLSKQNVSVAKRQLDLQYGKHEMEFDEIMQISNPRIRAKLLKDFADECDGAAVSLKAAALPRQATHVLLACNSLKPNEIYAPNYKNGEKVVLVRYPYAGPFESPELIVNNNNAEAKRMIGTNPRDAVMINHAVAPQLSGADHDGDTVLVIPNNSGNIKTRNPINELIGFDPNSYEIPKGSDGKPVIPIVKKRTQQIQMGKDTNLLTDMYVGHSPSDHELASVVKQTMVDIDAVKHELNYKQAYKDNNIAALKQKYQGSANSGAKTIISRASSQTTVDERKQGYLINEKGKTWYDPTKEEGAKIWRPTNDTHGVKKVDKATGETIWVQEKNQQKSTKMYEVEDAMDLVGDPSNKMEITYANYANQCKRLGNKARLELAKTEKIDYSPSAAKAYASEVASLKAKITLAEANAPLERKAQALQASMVKAVEHDNPDLDDDSLKKLKGRCLSRARDIVGAKKDQIVMTDAEWKAFNSGAITNTMAEKIMLHSDMDALKERALPRENGNLKMTDAKVAQAKALIANGYSPEEVAESIGVSVTTIHNYTSVGGKYNG
jgi:hypothetical protein